MLNNNNFYSGRYLSSNGTILNATLLDLDLYFQDQTFQVAILTIFVKAEKCKHYYCHQIGRHVFAIDWRHYELRANDLDSCECCTPLPSNNFSRSQI